MWRMKQRFPPVLITTCQILQPVRRSIEVILYWKGSIRMSAVVPRQNALGSRKRGGRDRNSEPADGKSLLAARVRLNTVAQWHSRWECPWMKHGETAGTGGNENMKGVGIVWVGTRDVYASDFGYMNNEAWTHCQIIITSCRPTIAHRWTTNLIESAELTCRPTWNSLVETPCHPFNFYHLQEQLRLIIRLSTDRTGMLFLAFDYLQQYMAA